jgi:hypothetical protein
MIAQRRVSGDLRELTFRAMRPQRGGFHLQLVPLPYCPATRAGFSFLPRLPPIEPGAG